MRMFLFGVKGYLDMKKLVSEAVMRCYESKGFVCEYNRLTGSSLRQKKLPIEYLIDDATGADDADLKNFVAFVVEYVVKPMVKI